MSIRETQTRGAYGGVNATLLPDKSSLSYGYYRRKKAQRQRLELEAALQTLDQSTNEGDNRDADYIRNRMTRLEVLQERPIEILAGQCIPLPGNTLPGQIPADPENNRPAQVNRLMQTRIIPGYDITNHEDPKEDQLVPVEPMLLAELQTYAMFKPRTTELLLSIKNKATQIVRRYDNCPTWKHHQIAMASALAFEPSVDEMTALKHVSSSAVASKWAFVNDRLSGGNKDLRECQVLKPKLVTRFLDWFHPKMTPQTPLPVKS